jgi:hypothetical protein
LITDAGLTVRHREILTKDIELEGWAGRMQASAETKEKLRGILRGTQGVLRDFLQPKELPDNMGFVLMESLIVAEKPLT